MHFLTLETSRLILKGFSPEDMKYVFDNLPRPEIMKLLGHRHDEEYLKEEYKHKNGYASYNRSFKLFLLIDKESGLIIGRCGLHNWNKDHKRAEIGYVMTEESFKRKGLMSEAVKAILNCGFSELGLNRIEAMVGTENEASLKLLERNRFTREGLLRQHVLINDTYEDSALFSLLRSEYYGQGNPA